MLSACSGPTRTGAIETTNEPRDIAPHNPAVARHIDRASRAAAAGILDVAADELGVAAELSRDPALRLRWADAMADVGDLEAAAAEYARLAVDSTGGETAVAAAAQRDALARLGDSSASAWDSDAAVQATALAARAQSALDAGEATRGAGLLSDAIARRPTVQLYADLGAAYTAANDPVSARRAWSRARVLARRQGAPVRVAAPVALNPGALRWRGRHLAASEGTAATVWNTQVQAIVSRAGDGALLALGPRHLALGNATGVDLWSFDRATVQRQLAATEPTAAASAAGAWVVGTRAGEVLVFGTDGAVKPLAGSRGAVTHVAINADATVVIAARDTRAIDRWTVADGKLTATVKAAGDVHGLGIASDPTGARTVAAVWRRTRPIAMVWSADGTALGGRVPPEPPVPTRRSKRSSKKLMVAPEPVHVAVSADGTSAARSRGGQVTVFDPLTGDTRFDVDVGADIDGLALRDDGGAVAAISGAVITVVEPGKATARLGAAPSPVVSLAVSADGTSLVAGTERPAAFAWNLGGNDTDMRHLGPLPFDAAELAMHPRAQSVAIASGGQGQLWGPRSGKRTRTFGEVGGRADAIAFGPEGTTVALGRFKTITLYDAATGAVVRTLDGPAGTVHGLAFSPDGTTLYAGGYNDGKLRMFDPTTGELIGALDGHTSYITAVRTAPNGVTLATGDFHDDAILVWDAETKAHRRLSGHTGAIRDLAYAPDSTKLASASIDGTARVWDLTTGESLIEVRPADKQWVNAVAFGPAGKALIAADATGSITVWRVADGALLATLRPHGKAGWLAYSPAGAVAASPDARGAFTTAIGESTAAWYVGWDRAHAPNLVARALAGELVGPSSLPSKDTP